MMHISRMASLAMLALMFVATVSAQNTTNSTAVVARAGNTTNTTGSPDPFSLPRAVPGVALPTFIPAPVPEPNPLECTGPLCDENAKWLQCCPCGPPPTASPSPPPRPASPSPVPRPASPSPPPSPLVKPKFEPKKPVFPGLKIPVPENKGKVYKAPAAPVKAGRRLLAPAPKRSSSLGPITAMDPAVAIDVVDHSNPPPPSKGGKRKDEKTAEDASDFFQGDFSYDTTEAPCTLFSDNTYVCPPPPPSPGPSPTPTPGPRPRPGSYAASFLFGTTPTPAVSIVYPTAPAPKPPSPPPPASPSPKPQPPKDKYAANIVWAKPSAGSAYAYLASKYSSAYEHPSPAPAKPTAAAAHPIYPVGQCVPCACGTGAPGPDPGFDIWPRPVTLKDIGVTPLNSAFTNSTVDAQGAVRASATAGAFADGTSLPGPSNAALAQGLAVTTRARNSNALSETAATTDRADAQTVGVALAVADPASTNPTTANAQATGISASTVDVGGWNYTKSGKGKGQITREEGDTYQAVSQTSSAAVVGNVPAPSLGRK